MYKAVDIGNEEIYWFNEMAEYIYFIRTTVVVSLVLMDSVA